MKLSQYPFIVLSICVFLLSSCNSSPTFPGIAPIDATKPVTPDSIVPPTPIPNLHAEAILDGNYDLFLAHLALTNWIRTPDEFLAELQSDSFVLDLRQPLEVGREGFIPGAILIPLREVAQQTSALPDFYVPVYTYSTDSWRCALTVAGLGVFGWEIRCLEGGFTAWSAAGGEISHGPLPYPEIDPLKPAFPCCGTFEPDAGLDALSTPDPNAPHPALVAALVTLFRSIPDDFGAVDLAGLDEMLRLDPTILVIDLRSDEAVLRDGQLAAQEVIHVPFFEMIVRRNTWPSDRSASFVIVSDSEKVTPVALGIFWAYGYRNARALASGYRDWIARD